MRITHFFSLVWILVTLTVVDGCNNASTPVGAGSGSENGTLTQNNPGDAHGPAQGNFRLLLTDAPFPTDAVASAIVHVTGVDARHAEGSFEPLSSQERDIDLLELRNGLTTVLLDTTLPNGTYDLVRLVISHAVITLKDGQSFNLQIPSGDASGLKLFLTPALDVSNLSQDLVIDFDLSRSFVMQGNVNHINGFIFKPVLRVALNATSGSLGGVIKSDLGTPGTADDLPLADALVTVSQDGTEIATALSGTDGSYQIIGLPAGTYSVTITAVGYTPTSFSVTIVAGNLLTENPVISVDPSTLD